MSTNESSTDDWRCLCSFCANRINNETAASADSITFLHSIAEKHSLTTLSHSDKFPLLICETCKDFLEQLNAFSERCMRTASLLHHLQTFDLTGDDVKLDELRKEYGLDVEEKYSAVKLDQSTATDDLGTNVPSGVPRKRRTRPTKTERKGIETQEYSVEIEVEPLNIDSDKIEDLWIEGDSDQENDQQNGDFMCDEMDETVNNGSVKSKTPKKRRKAATNEKSYNCRICRTEFKRKRHLDEHNRSHHPDEETTTTTTTNDYTCQQCSKKFLTARKLQRHEIVHLPDDQRLIHPCKFCDKRFSKVFNMEAHIRAIHTGDRPFICEECGKRFIAKGALKEHQIIHSDDCPFECAHCPKKFKNMARLRTHEDIHKHTTYVCPHCGLQLNTKRTLKMHMVVHSDLKRFKCQYCGNEYKRSKALKNHLILHTGLRPYTCPFCEKTFANGSNCRSHKKKAHPVELAALEASGQKQPAANIPKLEHLQPKPKSEDETMEIILGDGTDAIAPMSTTIIVENDPNGEIVYQTFV